MPGVEHLVGYLGDFFLSDGTGKKLLATNLSWTIGTGVVALISWVIGIKDGTYLEELGGNYNIFNDVTLPYVVAFVSGLGALNMAFRKEISKNALWTGVSTMSGRIHELYKTG